MSETQKPIKRSAELAPLSREHHEGLLAAWKLRQGLAKNIEAIRITAYLQCFWQTHLEQHFQKEETALPLVFPQSYPLLQQMLREHDTIKTLVAESVQHGDLKKLEVLAQTLTNHIRFEERQLFVEAEKAATPEQLQQLSELLKDEPHAANWKDPFWVYTK